jgi:hypothetical protein
MAKDGIVNDGIAMDGSAIEGAAGVAAAGVTAAGVAATGVGTAAGVAAGVDVVELHAATANVPAQARIKRIERPRVICSPRHRGRGSLQLRGSRAGLSLAREDTSMHASQLAFSSQDADPNPGIAGVVRMPWYRLRPYRHGGTPDMTLARLRVTPKWRNRQTRRS